MRKLLTILAALVLVFTSMSPAQAASKDICTPDIVVNGIITVKGSCVKTDPLPTPLPPVPTVKPSPIVVPVSPLPTVPPIKIPPIVVPPILPTPRQSTPGNTNTPRPSTGNGGTPKPQPTPAQNKTQQKKKAIEKKKAIAKQEAIKEKKAQEHRQRVANYSFIGFSILAGLGLMYILFYRQKRDRHT